MPYICLKNQGSEYVLGPKYAKILNMTRSQYALVTQHSEYARLCLNKTLNISLVLNMPGFSISQCFEYATVYTGF